MPGLCLVKCLCFSIGGEKETNQKQKWSEKWREYLGGARS